MTTKPADVLIHGAEQFLHEKRQQLSTKQPGAVLVQPPPLVGWSITGQLTTHNSLVQPTPPKQLQLQVAFDKQMQTHTVQFNAPDNNIPLGSVAGIICEAEIIWSVEGTQVRRVVSVSDGVAISGEAQGVAVNIYDASFDSGFTYTVGATVAPGVRGNTQQPPTLRVNGRTALGAVFPYSAAVAAGATAFFDIPPNVGAVSSYMEVTNLPAAVPLDDNDITIVHRIASGVPIKQYGLNGCFKYIPLFGSTKSIEITNNSAGFIIMSHQLGIEG